MSEFGRGSFGERMIMVCQVCNNNHHESGKEVFVPDPRTGVVKRMKCPLCCCLDCVQTSDDPIRRQIRPLMMGQTLSSKYNLNVDEFKPGQQPTKRNISINAPGPLNMKDAMAQIQGMLGLQAAEPRRHGIGQAVGCGCWKNAVSKCIGCEAPLCMKCLKSHDCDQ
jgi:hypothetical protein